MNLAHVACVGTADAKTGGPPSEWPNSSLCCQLNTGMLSHFVSVQTIAAMCMLQPTQRLAGQTVALLQSSALQMFYKDLHNKVHLTPALCRADNRVQGHAAELSAADVLQGS